jgi:Na+/melibiose symporter-like transporter
MVVFLGLSSAITTGIYVGSLSRVIASYVLLLCCLTSCLSLLGAFTVSETRATTTPHHHTLIQFLRHQDPNPVVEGVSVSKIVKKEWQWKSMLRDSRFWLLCCIHCFGTGAGQTFINVLGSWHLSLGGGVGLQTTAVIVLSVCNAIGRICLGSLSDVTLHKVKRAFWALPSLLLLVAAFILCLVAPSDPNWVIGVSVLVGLGYGGNCAFLPTITADIFGPEFFGRNWSLVDAWNGFGYLLLGQGRWFALLFFFF